LLRRFAAEAAREEARIACQEIVGETAIEARCNPEREAA